MISIDLQCWNVLTKSIAIMTKNEKCAVVRSKRKLLSYCVAYWFQYCIVELFIVHRSMCDSGSTAYSVHTTA